MSCPSLACPCQPPQLQTAALTCVAASELMESIPHALAPQIPGRVYLFAINPMSEQRLVSLASTLKD